MIAGSSIYAVRVDAQRIVDQNAGTGMTEKLQEHDVVLLARPMPDLGLGGDEIGTVVHVYADSVFEIEFLVTDGRSCLVTLHANDLRLTQRFSD